MDERCAEVDVRCYTQKRGFGAYREKTVASVNAFEGE